MRLDDLPEAATSRIVAVKAAAERRRFRLPMGGGGTRHWCDRGAWHRRLGAGIDRRVGKGALCAPVPTRPVRSEPSA